jgi:hypothetical protein
VEARLRAALCALAFVPSAFITVFAADAGQARALEVLAADPPLLPAAGGVAAAPERLALDALGRLFVLDRGSGRIFRRDDAGGWIEFGSGEQGGARLAQITGIFARPGPDLFALDGPAGTLCRFDLEGRLRAVIPWRDVSEEIGAFLPADFAMTPSGELVLLDRDGGRLLRVDRDGRLLVDLASGLVGSLRLRAPARLAVDAEGTLFVLDPPGTRVLRFTRQGDALPPWNYGAGLAPDREEALLAIRPGGSILVVSRDGAWVRSFDGDGALQREWRGEAVSHPLSDAVASDSLLYLACPGGGRILRWRLPADRDAEPANGR